MKALRAWASRLLGLLPSARRERELADELEGHLQMHIDDNLRAGMSPGQARRDAVMRLGGIEPAKQIYRERRSVPFLESALQNFRFAMRQLRKNPGFTATAISILALGMSASVAIFAFVDAALIKPLPYQNPARMISVYETAQPCPQCPLSYLDFLDWKKLNTVFQSMDALRYTNVTVSVPEGAESAESFRITPGFFRTLGVAPALGRDFYDGEDSLAAPHTVMLSDSAWKRRYGGKPDVLGKTVTLNGDPRIIIGVLPPQFHFASAAAEFWTPLYPGGGCHSRRNCRDAYVVARLKDGVSIETALANLKVIAGQLEKQYPDSNRGYGAKLAALSESMVGEIRPILLLLLAAAGLLLLIAVVDVASLMLVRSESRKREIAVRSALGASRARIRGLFAAEGLVLAAAGTALALAMASWATHLLTALIPADKMVWMPFLKGIGLNVRVLGFSGSIALLAALFFSFTPSLHFSFSNTEWALQKALAGRPEERGAASDRSWS